METKGMIIRAQAMGMKIHVYDIPVV